MTDFLPGFDESIRPAEMEYATHGVRDSGDTTSRLGRATTGPTTLTKSPFDKCCQSVRAGNPAIQWTSYPSWMKRINMQRNRRIAAMAITKNAVTQSDMLSKAQKTTHQ